MNRFQEDRKELSKLRSEIINSQDMYCEKTKQVLDDLLFRLDFCDEVTRISDGRTGKFKVIRKDSVWGSNPYVIGFYPLKKDGTASRVVDTYFYIDSETIDSLAENFKPFKAIRQTISNKVKNAEPFKRTGRKIKLLTAEQIAEIQFYLSTPNASYSKCGERIGVSPVVFGRMVKKYTNGIGIPKGEIK